MGGGSSGGPPSTRSWPVALATAPILISPVLSSRDAGMPSRRWSMAKMQKTKTKYAGVFRLDTGGWWIQATQRDADGRRKAKRRVLPSAMSIDEAARARAATRARKAP